VSSVVPSLRPIQASADSIATTSACSVASAMEAMEAPLAEQAATASSQITVSEEAKKQEEVPDRVKSLSEHE